jgi:cobalt/nickel transport system permease protein
LLVFVCAVVVTPKEAMWAHALHAALLLGAVASARIPLPFLLRRLGLELPFISFALFLPFVSGGPSIDVGPLAVSRAGLWGAWGVIAKATLGLAASILLAATTSPTEILRGLERLRVPRALTAIAGFMVRYADVVTGEVRRMSVARQSRAYDPRWLWQARAVAASAGALFIRSFERGERVYLAMVSRGFDGTLPSPAVPAAPARAWVAALSAPVLAVLAAAAARWAVS